MTTDELWQAVIDAADPITRDEACRTYVAFTLDVAPTTDCSCTGRELVGACRS